MRKKTGLIAAVGLLLGVVGVLSAYAVHQLRKNTGGALAGVPRDAVAVVGVDLARLRGYLPAQHLRTTLAAQSDVRPTLDRLRSDCGFDPLDQVETGLVAWDRQAFQAHGGVSFAEAVGRMNRAAATQCLGAAVRLAAPGALVALPPVRQHPVFSIVRDGETTPLATPWAAALEHGALIASPAMMPHALAVVDHAEPGADRNERLRAALLALGPRPVAFALLDVQSLSETNQAFWLQGWSDLLRDVPTAGGLLILQTAQTLSAGLVLTPTGLRLVAVARMRSALDARTVAAAATSLLAGARSDALESLRHDETQFLAQVNNTQTFEAAVGAQVLPLQQAFSVLNSLYDRLRVRDDGTAVRAEAEVSTEELEALQRGLAALFECDAAYERTRPLRERAPVVAVPPTPPTPSTAPAIPEPEIEK